MPDFFLRTAQPDGSPERIPPTFSGEPKPPLNELDLAQASSPTPAGEFPAIYASDLPAGTDALGKRDMLASVAELLAHRRTIPPLTIGLFGGSGAGKSFALGQLLDRVEELTSAAATLASGSPFLSRIVAVRVEAARSMGDPATAMAAAIYRTLNNRGRSGDSYAALAQEALQAVRDPHVAAREASERLSEARHRLDAERQVRHDLDGRRAKLVDTVLYETAGSHVDSYTRANRARIEARLRSFGFNQGDPLDAYRDLVRDVAEASGASGRISSFFRALWAYRGQTKLLVLAVLLFLLAWGSAYAEATQESWLPSLGGNGAFGASVANWIEAHRGWFGTLGTGAFLAACLALVTCVWRALRFTQPIFRGASLLKLDLETRRRDLDALIANQTRRIDAVSAEGDAHARRAEEAERRARASDEAAARPAAPLVDSPFEPAKDESDQRARLAAAFAASLDAAMAHSSDAAFLVPQRIVVAIDDLDALPPARAAGFIEAAHRLLSARGFAVLLAADPQRLATAWGETDAIELLHKYVQVPIHLSAAGPDLYTGLAQSLVGGAPEENAGWPKPDASRSVLDLNWRNGEAALLAALAPLAGRSPRTVKRFVNIYRLARVRCTDYAAVALLLALDTGGTAAERQAINGALANTDSGAPLRIDHEPRLAQALEACRIARDDALTVGDVADAQAITAAYSM